MYIVSLDQSGSKIEAEWSPRQPDNVWLYISPSVRLQLTCDEASLIRDRLAEALVDRLNWSLENSPLPAGALSGDVPLPFGH